MRTRAIALPDDFPEIVVICGSARFTNQWIAKELSLELEGKIFLTVARIDHSGPKEEVFGHAAAQLMDRVHKRKIDLADRVFVLNVGGYIGSSTRSEIAYAQSLNVPIDYLEPPLL